MKTKPKARKAVYSFDQRTCNHRADFTHCPSCDAKFETEAWDAAATVLVLEEIGGKHGSVVVVSECPKCFEKSWVHHPFSTFEDYRDDFPDDWKRIAKAEEAKRHLSALRTFCDSLCAKCAHLRALKCQTLPSVDCTDGKDEQAKLPPGRNFYMRHSFSETVCANFKAR